MRLDHLLQQRYPEYSRSFLQRQIASGHALVNDLSVTKAGHKIMDKDVVVLATPIEIKPVHIPRDEWSVVHEDEAFIVIDKKPGVIVEHLIPPGTTLKLVHRLDKDTSGLLVIAKDDQACSLLQKQWHDRLVTKTYRTLVAGHLKPENGAIDAPIMRSFKDRTKMAVSASPQARPSNTRYKVLKHLDCGKLGFITYLEAYPTTGRTHQIRVHLASIGHSVLGDKTYGDKKLNEIAEDSGLTRQFLHAAELSFLHPQTKEKLTFCSELPNDLAKFLDGLK
jgi:23S rRNA pseudouridine1911/1915/1917 synthase